MGKDNGDDVGDVGEGAVDDGKEVDATTQKFLHILAQFLDREVSMLRYTESMKSTLYIESIVWCG